MNNTGGDAFESADSYVIKASLRKVMELVETQASLYSDARDKLVKTCKRQSLCLSNTAYFAVALKDDEKASQEMTERLKKLACRIKQLKNEREESEIKAQSALAQLHEENAHLLEELAKLNKCQSEASQSCK